MRNQVSDSKEWARRAMAEGDYQGASDALEAYLEASPEDVEALLLLATVCLLRDDRSEFALLLHAAGELVEQTKTLPRRVARLWDRCVALARRAGFVVALAGSVAGCSKASQPKSESPVVHQEAPPRQRTAPAASKKEDVISAQELVRIRSAYPDPGTLNTAQLRAKVTTLEKETAQARGTKKGLFEKILADYKAELAKRVPKPRETSQQARPTSHGTHHLKPRRPRRPMSTHRYSGGVFIRQRF